MGQGGRERAGHGNLTATLCVKEICPCQKAGRDAV